MYPFARRKYFIYVKLITRYDHVGTYAVPLMLVRSYQLQIPVRTNCQNLGLVQLCQGLNVSMRMWTDYSGANENLSTKKGRMKCGRMPDYVHDTKLDTWLSRTHDYGRRSVWIRDNIILPVLGYRLPTVCLFWPVCSPAGLLAWRVNRPGRYCGCSGEWTGMSPKC